MLGSIGIFYDPLRGPCEVKGLKVLMDIEKAATLIVIATFAKKKLSVDKGTCRQ